MKECFFYLLPVSTWIPFVKNDCFSSVNRLILWSSLNCVRHWAKHPANKSSWTMSKCFSPFFYWLLLLAPFGGSLPFKNKIWCFMSKGYIFFQKTLQIEGKNLIFFKTFCFFVFTFSGCPWSSLYKDLHHPAYKRTTFLCFGQIVSYSEALKVFSPHSSMILYMAFLYNGRFKGVLKNS